MRRAALFAILAILGVWIALIAASCSAQAFTVPPHLREVTLYVYWSTPDEIRAICGKWMAACSMVGQNDNDFVAMRVQKPTSFSDPLVCDLGHEVLHALGARHE